jgi:hypothetical protein
VAELDRHFQLALGEAVIRRCAQELRDELGALSTRTGKIPACIPRRPAGRKRKLELVVVAGLQDHKHSSHE